MSTGRGGCLELDAVGGCIGTGGRTGEGLGGIMPGSMTAHFHSEIRESIEAMMEMKIVNLCVVQC